MRYQHRFQVRAPLAQVAGFHTQSQSMAAITPPPIRVQVHTAPDLLAQNDIMEFTLWLGIFPIHWIAGIEQVSPNGFLDRQIRGPFRIWEHRHTFLAISDSITEVRDEIIATIRWHPLFSVIGIGMIISLPLLFAYRGWKTRRLLENRPNQMSAFSNR